MTSGVFGIAATDAPMSTDSSDLITLGGVASVLLEDAPQVRRVVAWWPQAVCVGRVTTFGGFWWWFGSAR